MYWVCRTELILVVLDHSLCTFAQTMTNHTILFLPRFFKSLFDALINSYKSKGPPPRHNPGKGVRTGVLILHTGHSDGGPIWGSRQALTNGSPLIRSPDPQLLTETPHCRGLLTEVGKFLCGLSVTWFFSNPVAVFK